jgi:hypothetical protein
MPIRPHYRSGEGMTIEKTRFSVKFPEIFGQPQPDALEAPLKTPTEDASLWMAIL